MPETGDYLGEVETEPARLAGVKSVPAQELDQDEESCPRHRADAAAHHAGERIRERRVMLGMSQQELAAMIGVTYRGLDRNILVEIGLIVLVGLAAKNAILIVEFAKQAEEQGQTRFEAAVSAARTRLRPILMTSFAFILGVLPLARAQGAGAEMRQSLGTAVFAGMLGVTFFGLVFTPTFYVLVRWVSSLLRRDSKRI